MMRFKCVFAIIVILVMGAIAEGQYAANSYYGNDFLMSSPGSFYEGLGGFANPANLTFLKDGELRFNWSTEGTKAGSFQDWGLFISVPHLGFGMVKREIGDWSSTDYRLSLGLGNDREAVGLAYGWSGHTVDSLANEKVFKISSISRPLKYLSLGLSGEFSMESSAREGAAEIGIRPLGTSVLTIFGDIAFQKKTVIDDAPWSVGAVVEPISGICLTGRYFESEAFTVGLLINFGYNSLSGQMHYDADQNHSYNTYSARVGGFRPSFFPTLIEKDRRYLKISLKGKVSYLGFMFWDKERNRLLEVLKDIEAAGDDPRVAAIALNLADSHIAPEHAWEIREALKEFREKGKEVVVFLEDTFDREYHLASVGDRIVIDPNSIMGLAGYSISRTYMKGTLEKLGLGFDEWRLFKYKSAAETFSRDNMSEADREQYQAYVDDWYESTRSDICQSRGMTFERYDQLINSGVLYLPDQAIEFGLVDTIARWSDVDKLMDGFAGMNLRAMGQAELYANVLPPKFWGGDPEIAVVYALGDCDMERGIRARWLSRKLASLARDRSIKAVVFRVDSPGGDGMASDIVAEALKKCAAKKPVIVSQGQVAGSGGYWISMYGDKILAGPNTITGSIGVIGGWIWDKEMSGKLGMSYDKVQRGDHADILQGVRLPVLNITVPGRNLTADERSKVEALILQMYDDFVAKVAEGRQMTVERVKEIGAGRFYSGLDGLDVGLIDEIGGLMMAIEIAKDQAGIARDQRVELKEFPEHLGFFPFRKPVPAFGLEFQNPEQERAIEYIKMLNESPYKAIPMIPPGDYPAIE